MKKNGEANKMNGSNGKPANALDEVLQRARKSAGLGRRYIAVPDELWDRVQAVVMRRVIELGLIALEEQFRK